MKYERVEALTEAEILERLSRPEMDWGDRHRTILAAMYYSETPDFPCDLLLAEFRRAGDEQRPYVANMIGSFYGMWHSIYRIDDAMEMLRAARISDQTNAAHLSEIIEDLADQRKIYDEQEAGSAD